MTEKELINSCNQGDRKSQKLLYETYSGQMYSICLRYCKDAASAADALQLGFIKVFKNIGSFKGDGSFEGWIKKIIVRAAIDQFNKDKKQLFYDLDNINEKNYSYDLKLDFDNFDYNQLLNLIEKLPDGYRVVFSMYVLDELSHKEIAAALNISLNTSRSQLLKARKLLQSLIKNNPYLVSKYLN